MDRLAADELVSREEEIIKTILEDNKLETYYYKETDSERLKMLVQKPIDWQPGQKRTAIIWIHGGAWSGGEMEYMNPHCRYFALRGAVTFNLHYRLMNSKTKGKGSTLLTCIEDCKEAVSYIRKNADFFGIDLQKIVAAGDSAGAHLACCLGTIDKFGQSGVSDKVNAVISCNGIVDLTMKYSNIVPVSEEEVSTDERYIELWHEHRKLAMEVSPLFNVKPGQPPMLILHGLSDETVEPEQSLRYYEKNLETGNKADLMLYPKLRHAFVLFNYKEKTEDVYKVLRDIDGWLCKQGFIK